MSAPLSRRSMASAFLRSFLIQGSWNYHTMIGTGFAFAMLPGLRSVFGKDGERLSESVRRHVEHFNAHPYLVGVALGAALRLEAEGEDPDIVRRLKGAVRGPLGGLGDALVWATWLPALSMAAVATLWLGAPGWLAVALFLLVYNVGHVGLRLWGFRTGLREGRQIALALGNAALTTLTERLRRFAAVCLGLLIGAALAGEGGLADSGALWGVLAAAAFTAGLVAGHRLWRPAAVAVVAAVGILATLGGLR